MHGTGAVLARNEQYVRLEKLECYAFDAVLQVVMSPSCNLLLYPNTLQLTAMATLR